MGSVAAVGWIGKPFPGFLVLGNGVVASVGLPGWEATRGGEIYQHEVIAIDGTPLRNAAALQARLAEIPAGTPITYRLRHDGSAVERTFPASRFSLRDVALLFGTYLLNGIVLGGAALLILARRAQQASARAALPFLLLGALWGLTAMDLYGPYRLFRVHALCESLLFAAALEMALAFPAREQRSSASRSVVRGAYLLGLALAVVYQVGLFDPVVYVWTHLLATSLGGAALCVFVVCLLSRYLRGASSERRETLRILLLGAVVALALPICLTIAEVMTGGRMSQNNVGFTVFLFPLAIGYAVLRGGLHSFRDAGPRPSRASGTA
jgi:hypothetical protein